jgi:outer membrane protein assembly factor BamE (lipoprotein component of BamABCDE complex)
MKKILVLACFMLMAGCTTVVRTQGTQIDREKVLGLKAGETTKQEILDTFGAPTDTSVESGDEKLTYVFKKKKTPGYLGGLVENEVQSKESVMTLELLLKNNIVSSFRFKSSEN